MLSYNQVAEAIEAEGRKVGRLAKDIASRAANAAESEAEHKIAYARARMEFRDQCAANGTKVTVDGVDDHAVLTTSDSLRAMLVTRESLTAAREALRASQARLDGLRTLAAGYRQAGG